VSDMCLKFSKALSILLMGAPALFLSSPAALANPFGVAPPREPQLISSQSGWLQTLAEWQSHFYGLLTQTVQAIQTEPLALASLLGFSFVYGLLHAAGPGHGKVIVSSYALAENYRIRRAIGLSFFSALLQAVTAITLVGLLAGVFNATSQTMTALAHYMELAGFGAIMLLGLWLVWRKILKPLINQSDPAVFSVPRTKEGHSHHNHNHDHHDHHNHGHSHGPHARESHCGCAHHLLHQSMLDQGNGKAEGQGDLRQFLAVAFSVGIRPCSGALIVLVLCLSQGLFLAGVSSTLLMALGTAVTVSFLAAFALSLRTFALYRAGPSSPWFHRAGRMIEALAALAVLTFGALLFLASFQNLP
jgi:nickel/cobalt exporter